MTNQCHDDDDDQGLKVAGSLMTMLMMKTVMMGSTTHPPILAILDLGTPKWRDFIVSESVFAVSENCMQFNWKRTYMYLVSYAI